MCAAFCCRFGAQATRYRLDHSKRRWRLRLEGTRRQHNECHAHHEYRISIDVDRLHGSAQEDGASEGDEEQRDDGERVAIAEVAEHAVWQADNDAQECPDSPLKGLIDGHLNRVEHDQNDYLCPCIVREAQSINRVSSCAHLSSETDEGQGGVQEDVCVCVRGGWGQVTRSGQTLVRVAHL